jgi:hypothetical protein
MTHSHNGTNRERRVLKVLTVFVLLIATLLAIGGLGLVFAAIWVYGPNSMRCFGSGALALAVDTPIAAAGVWLFSEAFVL